MDTTLVAAEHAGTRLDKYVAAGTPAISRTRAQELIDTGRILVNGKPAKTSYPVMAGDQITLPADISIPRTTPLPAAEAIPLVVVYEDAHLLVIDKPAGMVVHPAPGHASGTMVNALLSHSADLGAAESERPGIVHRLDKDTSGLLLVAKDDATLLALGEQMRAHAITKTYIALVEGDMQPPVGSIEAPIGRDPRHRQRMAIVSQGGREATTMFTAERVMGGRTLLRVQLVTGRTHQIRVHFAAVGHPVVGDAIYGRPQPPQPPRQFLHATRLQLAHPITGVPLDCTSPLPPDLAGFLAQIGFATTPHPLG